MRLILARLLVSTILLACGPAWVAAQQTADEQEIDELEPAVSSDRLAEMEAEDVEDVSPVVPSAVLAQDVTRRESASGVMDEIDLGRTEVTGNQELPKVLYIVPWKKSDPGELTGKPVNSLLDEVLAPIDRTEFIRQVDYYGDLYEEEEQ